MNRFCLLLILDIILLLGCDRDSDDGSTAFIDNDLNDGSPVVGIPAPTPFVPPGSPAVLTVPASDLVGTGGTVHVFTVSLLNITGNGSLSATTMIAAASGSLTGFPVSISFSPVIEIGPGAFSSTGTFSAALFGTGTVNTQIIYTEEDRTIASLITFSFSAAPPCVGGTETLVDHDGSFETGFSGLGCDAPQGIAVEYTSSLTPAPSLFITEVAFTLSTILPTTTSDFAVVVFAGGAPLVLASEIGRETMVGTDGATGPIIYTLITPIEVTSISFFVAIEAPGPTITDDVNLSFDTTTSVGTSWVYGIGACSLDPPMTVDALGVPGNWAIAVTVSECP